MLIHTPTAHTWKGVKETGIKLIKITARRRDAVFSKTKSETLKNQWIHPMSTFHSSVKFTKVALLSGTKCTSHSICLSQQIKKLG